MGLDDDLQDGGAVHIFLKTLYLYWLEALSLSKSMSKGVLSMVKLNALIQVFLDQRCYLYKYMLTESKEK
jgi:hypothetical protein